MVAQASIGQLLTRAKAIWQTIKQLAPLLAGIGIFISLHSCVPAQENGQDNRKEKVIADTANADTASNELSQLKRWIGEQPVSEEGSFLELPDVKPVLRKTVGTELYERLTNLQERPYYLTISIDYVDGYYFLHYPPNSHYNQRGDRVMIAFQPSENEMHVAIMNDQEVEWKHADNDLVPEFLHSRVKKHSF